MNRVSTLVLLFAATACAAADGHRELSWTLAEETQLAAFDFTDRAAFRCAGGALELFAAAKYTPPHRSPLGLAILRDVEFGDCELAVEAQQTGREYPHRDLVIVFAWRDAAHFAYAHLASAADPNAHQIMLVDGADRRPVTVRRSNGVRWGEGWHEILLVRRGSDVRVLFDGDEVLAGEVTALRGRIGLGSFDDTGRFRNLRVARPLHRRQRAPTRP
jgi:hypothetical protein